MDKDFNQTLTYSITNPIFTIVDNHLILNSKLNYDQRQFIPIIIRATDNGQPSTFVCLTIYFVILKEIKNIF